MPRVDPITGCPVMTQGEFWAGEAEHEGQGRSGAELMLDFYAELDESFAEQARKMQEDPKEIWEALLSWYIPDDSWSWEEGEEPEWVPESLLSVEEIEVTGSIRESGWRAVVRAHCSDGSERRFRVVSWAAGGSFYEPPDGGVEVEVIDGL